jgi:hypothetical protein
MTQQQHSETVAAEQEWRNEAGQTQAEYDAWFNAEKAEQFAAFEAIEAAFDSGVLEGEFNNWLMEPGRYRFGNGDDLLRHSENPDIQTAFIKWKAEQ